MATGGFGKGSGPMDGPKAGGATVFGHLPTTSNPPPARSPPAALAGGLPQPRSLLHPQPIPPQPWQAPRSQNRGCRELESLLRVTCSDGVGTVDKAPRNLKKSSLCRVASSRRSLLICVIHFIGFVAAGGLCGVNVSVVAESCVVISQLSY